MSVEALQSDKRRKNESLMLSIREDAQWSGALLQACKGDMAKGRMDQGRKAEEMGSELDRVTLSSRFPVVQGTLPETFPYRQFLLLALRAVLGTKPDGTPKVRPCDDFSR